MEEIKEMQIIMLCQILDQRFSEPQWQIIKKQPPEVFLQRQQLILTKLLKQKKLFEQYFDVFYSNHVKLLNWSLLAVDRKAQLAPYIFKTLVSKGSAFFNKKIKGLFQSRFKKKNFEKESLNLKQIKSMEEQIYKQFFYDMLERNSKQNSDKVSLMKLQPRRKEVQNMDSHEFYIKTFNACNGWNYIFYNYEKHMKGLSQKYKYNEKIRAKQQKSMMERQSQNSLGLLDFEHPEIQNPAPVKVHSITQVVQNSRLNSMRGFKSLVKGAEAKKLTFQNHLGKPITYRIARV